MTDKILSMMKKEHLLKSLDAGVFQKFVVRGMDFSVESYEAVKVGRVAVMRASGLFGMVKRDTLVISPLEKTAPVVTYERIKTFGKDIYIWVEYDLENEPVKIRKDGKKKNAAEWDEEIEELFANYLKVLQTAEQSKASERKKEIEELVNVMIEDYRISADIFLANYGSKITGKLYHEVMFGTR